MKDVRDELVRLVYKTVFICIAVFIIAVFVKDFYLNYLFGLLFYPLNKYIKFVLTFFICFWPFISAIMILLRATWFIIKNILLADVTNTSSKATDVTLVDVVLLDKNGKEIVTVGGIIKALKPGEKTQFNTSMTLDYANTYDFKIVIK